MQNDASAPRSGKRPNAFGVIVLIVIVLPLIVAILAPPRPDRISDTERAHLEVNMLRRLTDAFVLERTEGTLPSGFELQDLTLGDEPYIFNTSELIDPWGNPYFLVIPGEFNIDFDILSTGPDGTLGTEDDIISGEGF